MLWRSWWNCAGAPADYATRDGRIAADEYFFAEQNARLVRNAEEYYRAMFGGRAESWNLRDTHMMETLQALVAHIRQMAGDARAVIWAHTLAMPGRRRWANAES
jgi:erythromycin esterase-like protein